MGKSTHFIGQPLYSQIIKLLDKSKILQISPEQGGEHYTKRFTAWIHSVVMLYAIIKRFDSLREITASLLADRNKLSHLGITFKIGRSTLADANKRSPEIIFEKIYRDLYTHYRNELISDSRRGENSQMDETPANNIFHNHNLILQPYIQRCRSAPQERQEEGRNKGLHGLPSQ